MSSIPPFDRDFDRDDEILGVPSNRLDAVSVLVHTELATRQAGQQLHNAILDRLRQLPMSALLLVDLGGLVGVSAAALRLVVAPLTTFADGPEAERYLLYRVNTEDPDWLESLELVARANRRPIPVMDLRGQWRTFGKLTHAERETLQLLLDLGELSAAQLSERFDLLASAASNRLRRLHALRLIRREERVVPRGGREFLYRPLLRPPPMPTDA